MSHEYPQPNELPRLRMDQAPGTWNNFDFTEFSDFSFTNASDTQQMPDELLLQPLLDPRISSPDENAAQYTAWEWNGNDQCYQPEDSPTHQDNSNFDHALAEGTDEDIRVDAGSETISIGREVLDLVRRATQFEEHVKQRLAKIEKTVELWANSILADASRMEEDKDRMCQEIDANIEKLKAWSTEVEAAVQEARVRN
ncbi:hypothetical protein VDGL01_09898 [Verticillium dahliae]